MATTLLVSDSTQTPFTSGSAGLQIVRATATPYAGSPVGAVAGLQGNFVLDSSTDSVWMCTVSGTSGSAQWEQVLTDPNLYALINGSSSEAFNVASATTASGAVNLGQLQNGTESLDITGLTATSAQINGNATITGTATVSGATASGEAVNLGQVLNVAPKTLNFNGGAAASTTYAASATFTAPCDGWVVIAASWGNNTLTSMGDITVNLIINGTVVGTDTPENTNSWYLSSSLGVTAGTACTAAAEYVVGTTALANGIGIRGLIFFIPNP